MTTILGVRLCVRVRARRSRRYGVGRLPGRWGRDAMRGTHAALSPSLCPRDESEAGGGVVGVGVGSVWVRRFDCVVVAKGRSVVVGRVQQKPPVLCKGG